MTTVAPPAETRSAAQRWGQAAALALLVAAVLAVLWPFRIPIAWAAILAMASWPIFRGLASRLRERTTVAAIVMTFFMVVVVVGPTIAVSIALVAEIEGALSELKSWSTTHELRVPGWVQQIPWIGPHIAERAQSNLADPSAVQQWIVGQIGPWALSVAGALGNLGRVVLNAGVALLTLFFLYQHGAALALQIKRVATRSAGERVGHLIGPLGETVRAVMYGMIFTALAQGALAMLGYWVAGLAAPALLGALTALASFLPFGAPLVYGPAGAWLLTQGRTLAGIGLLAWGIVVVSTSDNLVRSWFISGATRMPFLLVLFGVLGGVAAFGSIGLFVGPIAIALLLELWREWADADAP